MYYSQFTVLRWSFQKQKIFDLVKKTFLSLLGFQKMTENAQVFISTDILYLSNLTKVVS